MLGFIASFVSVSPSCDCGATSSCVDENMREVVALAFAAGAAASPFDKNKWHFEKKPHGWYVRKSHRCLSADLLCADQQVNIKKERRKAQRKRLAQLSMVVANTTIPRGALIAAHGAQPLLLDHHSPSNS